MALKDVFVAELLLPEHIAENLQQEVLNTVRDMAVRREVFQFTQEDLDEISMVEIHAVLDALVKTLKGEDLG